MLFDVYDGNKWRNSILGDPVMSPGGCLGRNVVLGFCADGIAPFKRTVQSMWPMAMSCINLPAHMRMTLPALWLPCIVPSFDGHEADDLACYQEIIADEGNYLYHTGVEVTDASCR